MRKSIVFSSILAIFLMLMLPNISAVEYNTIEKSTNLIDLESFIDIDINLKESCNYQKTILMEYITKEINNYDLTANDVESLKNAFKSDFGKIFTFGIVIPVKIITRQFHINYNLNQIDTSNIIGLLSVIPILFGLAIPLMILFFIEDFSFLKVEIIITEKTGQPYLGKIAVNILEKIDKQIAQINCLMKYNEFYPYRLKEGQVIIHNTIKSIYQLLHPNEFPDEINT